MSPICIWPALMLLAPNHSIMTVTPYMMSVMTGPMNAMVRLTNSCVFMSAALAASKRACSCCSRWKARMTGRPVRISRLTRLTSSTRCCMARNCGMATFISTPTSSSIAATASAMTQPRPVFVRTTMTTPPSPMIGA